MQNFEWENDYYFLHVMSAFLFVFFLLKDHYHINFIWYHNISLATFCSEYIATHFLRFTTNFQCSEAALQRCSQEKVFLKYAAILQENTHAEVWVQYRVVLLQICRLFQNTFSDEHLWRTASKGLFLYLDHLSKLCKSLPYFKRQNHIL